MANQVVVVIVNGPDWIKALEHIKRTIALLALADGIGEPDVLKMIERYVYVIETNKDSIFNDTAKLLYEYLNFYKVLPRDGICDEFKAIYFSAIAVSSRLLESGLANLNKLHLRAMIRLLDWRLTYPLDVRRPVLTERLRAVIDNNVLDSHLGKYGCYLIYKCLFNAAKERTEKENNVPPGKEIL